MFPPVKLGNDLHADGVKVVLQSGAGLGREALLEQLLQQVLSQQPDLKDRLKRSA